MYSTPSHSSPVSPAVTGAQKSLSFSEMGLTDPLARAVAAEGYVDATPIQSQAIPSALDGRDLLACAQTGTGKTAAFVLPILQRLSAAPSSSRIRALVLTPTRELALQISERAGAYGRFLTLRRTVLLGGVNQRAQEASLLDKPDLLIATPGRLLDLMNQGFVRLDAVEVFVLDEADRMLDMGFIHDVKRIIAKLPQKRQTLFFSATMPDAAQSLARAILVNPVRIDVTPKTRAAETIEQKVYHLSQNEKRPLLVELLVKHDASRVIVFTRTKHRANRLSKDLADAGISALPIHGNKSQSARERALDSFRAGSIRVLVATDIAARGIDVDDVSWVVNFDLPNEPESYVHRIGRTGRAGKLGAAIAFCDPEERPLLTAIERLVARRIPVGVAEFPASPRPKVAPWVDPGAASTPSYPRSLDPRRRSPSTSQGRPGQASASQGRPGQGRTDAGANRSRPAQPQRSDAARSGQALPAEDRAPSQKRPRRRRRSTTAASGRA